MNYLELLINVSIRKEHQHLISLSLTSIFKFPEKYIGEFRAIIFSEFLP